MLVIARGYFGNQNLAAFLVVSGSKKDRAQLL